jgi:hypothetical protein
MRANCAPRQPIAKVLGNLAQPGETSQDHREFTVKTPQEHRESTVRTPWFHRKNTAETPCGDSRWNFQ